MQRIEAVTLDSPEPGYAPDEPKADDGWCVCPARVETFLIGQLVYQI